MKRFDLKSLEESIEILEEMKEEVKKILRERPAFYADTAGISRQMGYAVTSGKSKLSNKLVIKCYKNLVKYFDGKE